MGTDETNTGSQERLGDGLDPPIEGDQAESKHGQAQSKIFGPDVPQAGESPVDDIELDSRQRVLHSWLKKTIPEFAASYTTMLQLMAAPHIHSRINLVCHLARDILNGLLRAWSDEKGGFNASSEYRMAVENLLEVVPELRSATSDPEALDNVPALESGQQEAIRVLIQTHDRAMREQAAMERLAERLYGEFAHVSGEQRARLAIRLKDLHRWFANRAHVGSSAANQTTLEDLRAHLDRLTAVLWPLLEHRRAVLDRLDGLVERANLEPFKEPSDGDIEGVRSFLIAPDAEVEFFGRLKNPLWINPLRATGVFNGDNFVVAQFLRYIAPEDPAAVTKAFDKWDDPDVWVIQEVISTALDVPIEHADRLAQKLIGHADMVRAARYTTRVGKLIARLTREERGTSAKKLLNQALLPLRDDARPKLHGGTLHLLLKTLREDVIPAMSEHEPKVLLHWLCRTLKGEIEALGPSWREDLDSECYALPKVNQPIDAIGRDSIRDVVFLLQQAIGAVLDHDALDLASILDVLHSRDEPLFRRLQLASLSRFGKSTPELVVEAIFDEDSMQHHLYLYDYGDLIENQLESLTDEQRSTWFERIAGGPTQIPQWVSDEDKEKYEARWTMNRMSFAPGVLNEQHKELLAGLRAKYPAELPPKPWKTQVRNVSYTSPYSVAELQAIGFEAAFRVAEEWRPPEHADPIDDPSMEGLLESLGGMVRSDPIGAIEHADRLAESPPWLLRQFFGSLRQVDSALVAGHTPQLLSFCSQCIPRVVQGAASEPAPDHRQIPAWITVVREMVDLMHRLLDTDGDHARPLVPLDARTDAWRVIDGLFQVVWRDHYTNIARDADVRRLPLQRLPINEFGYSRTRMLLTFVWWTIRHGLPPESRSLENSPGWSIAPEARVLLEAQIDQQQRTLASYTAIGERLRLLSWLDGEWVRAHLDDILPLRQVIKSEAERAPWSAWSAFLFHERGAPRFWSLLEPAYRSAIDIYGGMDRPESPDEDPAVRMGVHLVDLVTSRACTLEKGQPLRKLLHVAEPWLRVAIMNRVCEIVSRTDGDIPRTVMEQFEAIWEFYWSQYGVRDATEGGSGYVLGDWFASGRSSMPWSLDQMGAVVDAGVYPQPDYRVAERLLELAPEYPTRCGKILLGMLQNSSEPSEMAHLADVVWKTCRVVQGAGGVASQVATDLEDQLLRRQIPELPVPPSTKM